MANYTTQVVSVGVDWVTASAQGEQRQELLKEYGLRAVGSEASKGFRMFESHMHGLSGWRTRHAACLWKDGLTVVELHEQLAHEQWADLLELAEGVSRLDTEVTVRQEPFDRQMALRLWDESLAKSREVGKDPYYDLYARKGKGNTLYIGSGASRFKARLYDKAQQSREVGWRDCWRYEVQARRERAVQVAERLRASPAPADDMAAMVHDHFAARGVVPIYEAGSFAGLPAIPRTPTDAERALAWVETAWRPTLRRLASWGAEGDAWRVLGFALDPHTGKKLREPLED